jgi:exopolysaccharide biosynthesis protein
MIFSVVATSQVYAEANMGIANTDLEAVRQDYKQYVEDISGTYDVNGKDIKVKGYHINLKGSDLEFQTALAKDSVGQVDSLENIALENEAVFAINGSYFSAYDDTEIKDPYGVLISKGRVVHNANDRAVIGFSDQGVDIDRIDMQIKGANGEPRWKYSWNGYWINHKLIEGYPSLTIFNDARNETDTPVGRNYIVEKGYITRIVDDQSVVIPDGGYVANLYGVLGEDPSQVYDRFQIGYPFSYEEILIPENGDDAFWNSLDNAVGAGPALILDGAIDIDFEGEKFFEQKIRVNSAARSAIGYMPNGTVVVVTTNATIEDLAQLMYKLGCYEAMNLDGGASSGMWYEGAYIRKPGREISNALIIKYKENEVIINEAGIDTTDSSQ